MSTKGYKLYDESSRLKNLNVFDCFNQSNNALCPVCHTNDDMRTVVVAKDSDGIAEIMQVHEICFAQQEAYKNGYNDGIKASAKAITNIPRIKVLK